MTIYVDGIGSNDYHRLLESDMDNKKDKQTQKVKNYGVPIT